MRAFALQRAALLCNIAECVSRPRFLTKTGVATGVFPPVPPSLDGADGGPLPGPVSPHRRGVGVGVRLQRRHLAAFAGNRVGGLHPQLPVVDVGRGRVGSAPGRHPRLAGHLLPLPVEPPAGVGLVVAPGLPRLHHRLHLHRAVGFRRPGAILVARGLRRGLLVSRSALSARRGGDVGAGVVSVCLSADPGGVPRAVGVRGGGGPGPGRRPGAGVFPGRVAPGPTGDCGGLVPGVNGNPGGLRRRAVLRRRHLHHRHLQNLVRLGQQRRRRPTLRPANGLRAGIDPPGKPRPQAGPLPPRQQPLPSRRA